VKYLAYARNGCSEEAAAELRRTFETRMRSYEGATYTLAKVVESTRLCAALVAAQRKSATEFFSTRAASRP